MFAGAGLGILVLFWLVFVFMVVGGVVIALWALIDAFSRPEWAWEYSGENREMYLVLLGGSLLVCQPLGWIPGLMYFLNAKHRIVAVENSLPRSPSGYPTYGPQAGNGPPMTPGYGPPPMPGYGGYSGPGTPMPQPPQSFGGYGAWPAGESQWGGPPQSGYPVNSGPVADDPNPAAPPEDRGQTMPGFERPGNSDDESRFD